MNMDDVEMEAESLGRSGDPHHKHLARISHQQDVIEVTGLVYQKLIGNGFRPKCKRLSWDAGLWTMFDPVRG